MIAALICAWLDLKRTPLRALAAFIGMTTAVCALVTVNAAGLLSRSSMDEYLRRQFGEPATLQADLGTSPGTTSQRLERNLQSVLTDLNVTQVSSFATGTSVAVRGDVRQNVQILAVQPAYAQIRHVDLLAGRFPTGRRSPSVVDALVSQDFVSAAGLTPAAAVGQSFRLLRPTNEASPDPRYLPSDVVVIDGVVDTLNDPVFDASVILVNDSGPGSLTPSGWLLHVRPKDASLVRATLQNVTSAGYVQGGGALTVRRIDKDEQLQPVILQQTRAMGLVAWVAMAVGGLGLVSVALASVRQRTREYGLRRALGATRRTVFLTVVAETVFGALLAAACAIPVSIVTVAALTSRLVIPGIPVPSHPVLPLASALTGVLAALAVGVAAAVLPAIRATRLSVINAVRD